MSSRSSSLSSVQSKLAFKASTFSGVGSDEYRYDVLEPNNILLDDATMDHEKWSLLAFSLGMPARHGQRFNSESQKLAQRLKRRKALSASQTFDYIKPFLECIVADAQGISQQIRSAYHGDAVPTHDALRNTIHRLPIPKPAFSLGYTKEVFSRHHYDLQDGIITGPNEEPYNLKHVSQPVTNHFWPFFVVEISDKSMVAAQQANAVTAATCSNALSILAAAVMTDNVSPRSSPSFQSDENITRSFSLSISGKEACLSSHGAQGSAPFLAIPVVTYRLDNAHDVACLADRIYNIMVWSRNNRLAEISTTLDALDRKVYGQLSGSSSDGSDDDFDLARVQNLKLKSSRRPAGANRIKIALRASLPSWLED